jgi:formylglycine-generating enzyme required for sulfatase activity
MLRLTPWLTLVVFVLVPLLPLSGNQGGKDKEDPLIAAMKFVTVPKGTFWMGWRSGNPQSKQVTIDKDFELAAYTVTQSQWQALIGNNPSHFSRQGPGKEKIKDISNAELRSFPVEMVTWNDVQEFLKKLNAQQQGKGWLYRLPTETEWEYACRGAATTKEECSFDFYFDKPTNDLSSKEANFSGDFPVGMAEKGPTLGRPAKVGSYPPNKLGLYDMHGNVWQWCDNLFGAGIERAERGGSWGDNGLGLYCKAAERFGVAPTERFNNLGFRVCRVSANAK